ncbi:putative nuclease HARBI1 [Ambystoma mexicanum]|uniref:putative nuclease HARBI1 n=1 Tax=Ambystoma mexicanum TaxID=8296 RepID=UPI0037E8B503
MSQPTFTKVLDQVLDALMMHAHQQISMLITQAQVHAGKARFYSIAHFSNTIAALDCNHVVLVTLPQAIEQAYCNRKQNHSVNVQVICDADLTISHRCAEYPHATNDALILCSSTLHAYMERHRGQHTWLVGDVGYLQLPWIMTHVRNPATPQEMVYNEAQRRTRSGIERTFGLLKSRFRSLHHTGGALMYSPEKVEKIIVVYAMLHNMCIRSNVTMPAD